MPRAVVALGTVSLLTDVSSESVAAVLPVYATAVLGLTPLAYGVVDGLYQGASGVVRILGGYAADRTSRPKPVALAGYALSAITRPLLVLTTGFVALTGLVVTDRLGKGLRTGPRDALIAAATPPPMWGKAFGTHRALDTVGAALGPLLAFLVLWAVPQGFSSVFVVSTTAALMGLAVLLLTVPDLRPGGDAEGRPARRARPTWSGLRSAGLRAVILATGLLGVLSVSDGLIYLSLQQRDSLAATWFPLLFVGTNLAYALLSVPMGRLADRVGRQHVLIGGHVLLLAAYLVAAGPTAGPAPTLAVLALLGAFYAATDGVLAALTSGLSDVTTRATAIATAQTVGSIARFGSSLVFGVLWTTTGRGGALLCFAAALALAIPLAWWLLRGHAIEPGRR